MPSPFLGMDPCLEHPDLWSDVHAELISAIRYHLGPVLEPKYVARVEQRTFLFDADDPAEELYVVPDARVLEREPATAAVMTPAPRAAGRPSPSRPRSTSRTSRRSRPANEFWRFATGPTGAS